MSRKLHIILFALFVFSSCTTQRKAFDWMDHHPVEAAKYSVSRFPIKSDTVRLTPKIIHTSDTLVLPGDTIPCPAPSEVQPTPKVICPATRIITNTDTIVQEVWIEKENPAKDRIITSQDADIVALTNSRNQYKARSKKYLFYIIIASILLFGSIGLNIKRF